MSLEKEIDLLRGQLQAHGDYRATQLTGWGPTRTEHETRDANADALAQLAEAVRHIAGHLGL